jgi:hypothetical protein
MARLSAGHPVGIGVEVRSMNIDFSVEVVFFDHLGGPHLRAMTVVLLAVGEQ